VFSQTPNKPIWPSGWSATVEHRSNMEPRPGFFRWFWDDRQLKDRMDGLTRWREEEYFAERLFDHLDKTEYNIFYQPGLVNCFTRSINATMPHPDFSRFTYIGKAIINFLPAYHWYYDDSVRKETFQLYDRQDNREILRIDFDDHVTHRSERFVFFEYDVGPQDPTLFVVDPNILAQCNPF